MSSQWHRIVICLDSVVRGEEGGVKRDDAEWLGEAWLEQDNVVRSGV